MTLEGTKLGDFIATLKPAITLRGSDDPNYGTRDDVVKRIREELKLAIRAGLIPAFCKFSVRKPDWNSIDVDLVQWEGRVFSDEYQDFLMAQFAKSTDKSEYVEADFRKRGTGRDLPRYVPELAEVHRVMEVLSNRHNFDESDMMTDYFHVGYYLHCEIRDIEWAASRAIQLECDPEFAALHARATAAIASLHPDCRDKIVTSVFGRRGFEGAGEWGMNDVIQIAERAKGRLLAYDKRQRGWRVVKDGARFGAAISGTGGELVGS